MFQGKKMTAKARSLKQAAKKLAVPKPKKGTQAASEAPSKPAPDEGKKQSCSFTMRESWEGEECH